ncbi:hypothetical protein NMY22_g4417 [Coprinellus aureogranulatus]|nr:hypothetical protein NMY22_g4417 [Coprinellus aureogranulatus]
MRPRGRHVSYQWAPNPLQLRSRAQFFPLLHSAAHQEAAIRDTTMDGVNDPYNGSSPAREDDVTPESNRSGDTPIIRGGPLQEVLSSQDIVPQIIMQLKELVGDDESRKAVAPLLVINKAFFHGGIGVLWRTMDSLLPVLKLLPWSSGSSYNGIGAYKYTGAKDWELFNFYSAHIRSFTLVPSLSSGVDIAPHLILELVTLHGRPDPFFPQLQHITVDAAGHAYLPLLFLFVTPSLRSADRPLPFASLSDAGRNRFTTIDVASITTCGPTGFLNKRRPAPAGAAPPCFSKH